MFQDDDPNSDMPTTERIPSVLMQHHLGKGHILYTDNFYTSPTLAAHLLENQTYLCGTVRLNRRHIPKELVDVQLQKSEAAFFKRTGNDNQMLVCKY